MLYVKPFFLKERKASYRKKGFNIEHIIFDFPGLNDEGVISHAISKDQIILTFDRDFGELIFKKGYKPRGVVYFRWRDYLPLEPGEYLSRLVEEYEIELESNFTVIDRDKIRQRKLL